MPFTQRFATRQRRWVSFGAALAGLATAPVAIAQVPAPNPNGPKANWTLFNQFGTASLRNMTFSTTITPRWIGESDSLFYSWRDHSGDKWWLVNAVTKVKKPLFDHVKMAAQLSVLRQRAIEAFNLSEQFTIVNITKDHKSLRFAIDSTRYNWNIATETLTSLGRYRGAQDSLMVKDEEVDAALGAGGGGGGGRGGGGGGGGRGGAAGAGGRGAVSPGEAARNYSPDSSAFVFARNHNLFIVKSPRATRCRSRRKASTNSRLQAAVVVAARDSRIRRKVVADSRTNKRPRLRQHVHRARTSPGRPIHVHSTSRARTTVV